MSRTEIKPISAVKVTRDFEITKFIGREKFSSRYTPARNETTYMTNGGTITLRWFDNFAIEIDASGKRYKIRDDEYMAYFARYHPLPHTLRDAMFGAYIKEINECHGNLYFIKKFAEGALHHLGIKASLTNISVAFLNKDEDLLKSEYGIDMAHASMWNDIAFMAHENGVMTIAFDQYSRRNAGYLDMIKISDPVKLKAKRIKELLSDGFNAVANDLNHSTIVHEAQGSALNMISGASTKEMGHSRTTVPVIDDYDKVEKALIRYLNENGYKSLAQYYF